MLVDKVSKNFKNLLNCMNFSSDDFIRTTEKRHIDSCQKIWKKIENELFQGLLVKMVSDKGLVISETDLT